MLLFPIDDKQSRLDGQDQVGTTHIILVEAEAQEVEQVIWQQNRVAAGSIPCSWPSVDVPLSKSTGLKRTLGTSIDNMLKLSFVHESVHNGACMGVYGCIMGVKG